MSVVKRLGLFCFHAAALVSAVMLFALVVLQVRARRQGEGLIYGRAVHVHAGVVAGCSVHGTGVRRGRSSRGANGRGADYDGWMMLIEKLEAMGIELPPVAGPFGAYAPVKREGGLIYVAGQLPMKEGKLLVKGPVESRCRVEH